MFGRWARIGLAAVSLTALPAFAYADGAATGKAPSGHVKDGEKSKAQFPMPAAQYKAMIEARIAKTRATLVAKMDEKKVSAERQEKVLARFDKGTETIMAKVNEVCADGTVTREEARQVNELARSVRHHGHKGHKKGEENPTRASK